MIAQIFDILGAGANAVIHWFYDILTACFGNVENFLFILAPILVITWLLRLFGVFGSGSDGVRIFNKEPEPKHNRVKGFGQD